MMSLALAGCDVGSAELASLSETLVLMASDEDVRELREQNSELAALIQELRDTIVAQEARIEDLEESYAEGFGDEHYATRAWVESLNSANTLLSSYVTVDEAEGAVIFSGIDVHIRSGSGTTSDCLLYTSPSPRD